MYYSRIYFNVQCYMCSAQIPYKNKIFNAPKAAH